MRPLRTKFSVGYLLPRLLILFGLLDVSLRIAQVGFGAFVRRGGIPISAVPGQPFKENVQVQLPSVYGNLAEIGNLSDRSESRSLHFSSDFMGFRNTGLTGQARGLLMGDSFSWSGADDGDTLPARVGRQLGCRILNASGPGMEFRRPTAELVHSIAEKAGIDKGFVILQDLEQRSFERIRRRSRARVRSETWWRRAGEFIRRVTRSSPIQRYAEKSLRSLHDDHVLPNAYADNIVQGRLRNGDIMSFLPDDLRPPSQALPFPVGYWKKLKQDLLQLDYKLFVIVVPNKYTVYNHLLARTETLLKHDDELVNRVEKDLRSLGIPVLNLTPIFKAHAEAGIDSRQYIYWRHDTHWNPEGVKIAAEEIARAFPELKDACR